MKNPFYFHRNHMGIWMFGNTWISDFIGGIIGIGCIAFALFKVLWREALIVVLIIAWSYK